MVLVLAIDDRSCAVHFLSWTIDFLSPSDRVFDASSRPAASTDPSTILSMLEIIIMVAPVSALVAAITIGKKE